LKGAAVKTEQVYKGGGLRWVFRLYVAGQMPKSLSSIAQIKGILDEELDDSYALEVVDILKQSARGIQDEVFVAPTLVRIRPEPRRSLIGTSTRERILELLRAETEVQSKK
jgi:circadian clock protein KaiB